MSTNYDIDDLDGYDAPYVPDDELDIPGDIDLHTDTVDDVDPVTYKVIQHSLWNINQQHGETIENLAVSPITLETRDFQPGIQQADGDFLYFGQYLQYFAGVLDLNVKWILENRSDDPGIEPGDMFLNNDPWVGAPHQQDVTIAAPVFHEGEIFCWVANVAHQNDIGGSVAGSFCQDADDIYEDPVPIPPLKIVEGGEIRQDIEESYRRHSRTPVNLGLDLRAQIAGNNHARTQIKELIESYGADTVKTVMNRVTETSERSLLDILEKIPDGVWEQRMYQEVAKTGDRGTYEVKMRLEKDGNTLTFDNEGTHPAVGAISLPLAGWRGGVLSAVNFMLIPEEMGAVGGVAEHVEFEPEIGTLTAPEYGVATSPAGMYATHTGVAMTTALVSKMLLSAEDEDLRKKAMSTVCSQWAMTILEGTNQRGDYFVGPMMDAMFGSGAASPDRDGQFSNGVAVIPEGQAPNVELYERNWPILYLYRDEQPNSGGDGYRRGGNNGRLAFIQHKGDATPGVYTNEAVPKSLGLFGGGPGSRMQTRVARETDVGDRFDAGELPGRLDELDGDVVHPPGKGADLDLADGDVQEWTWQSTGGLGDPLDREAETVAADVAAGRLTEDVAAEKYGVVLSADGELDAAATAERRARVRDTCLRESDADVDEADSEAGATPVTDLRASGAYTIGDYLRVSGDALECSKCGHGLGTVDENVKHELARRERPLEDIGPLWIDSSLLVDDEMVYREFFCPGCATRVSTEVAQRGADIICDVRLDR